MKECVFFYLMSLLMFFSSIKERNRLISKRISNIYYWETLTFSKLVEKENLSERLIWRNALALESKKVQSKFGEKFILAFFYAAVFLQISFNFFCSGDKRFLSEFLKKWGWLQGHNERFPKYLG